MKHQASRSQRPGHTFQSWKAGVLNCLLISQCNTLLSLGLKLLVQWGAIEEGNHQTLLDTSASGSRLNDLLYTCLFIGGVIKR